MSFYRVGQNRRKRAPIRKKPGWDDTVQDLTVYRATPEEIMLRKEAHKSQNHMSVKLEKMRKEKETSKLTGAETKQLAIMKEILYDQNQLKEVLAKSDTMMAVVKDLFGDDPKRFMGFPNVTTAPHHEGDLSSLVASVPDIYTRTEKLSDSLMDQSALNDDLDMFYSDDDFDCPDPISYESKLNLQHFRDYLQEEKNKTDNAAPKSSLSDIGKTNFNKNITSNSSNNNANGTTQSEGNGKDLTQALSFVKSFLNPDNKEQNQLKNLPDPKTLSSLLALIAENPNANFQTPPKKSPPLPSERTPPSAMNDTKKIKRSKKILKSPNTSTESNSTTISMNDMRKALHELESEISAYEHQTGRCPQEDTHKRETFSGYTVALVTAVSRLVRYLKETDLRVRTEMTLREQLTQDVYQLRTIIDALATDLIVTQEEYGKLYSEYKRYRESSEADLVPVNNQLTELKQLVNGKELRPTSWNPAENQQQLLHQQQGYQKSDERNNISKQSETSTPLHHDLDASTQSELDSSTYQPLPTHLRHTESVAAVMLSPPIRKTRVRTSNSVDNGVQFSQRQTSLVDIPQLTNEGTTYSADPPYLTQAPPAMNTVSVPRPIPLVQSNLSIPLTSGQSFTQATGYTIANEQGLKGKVDGITSHSVQNADLVLQEMAVEEALNNPEMQSLMQAQIAELNRQQEDARRRLLDLLDSQRVRQKQMQGQFVTDTEMDTSIRKEMGWQSNIQKSVRQLVLSPPISPISQKSEQLIGTTEILQQTDQGKGITVSLPMTSLDDSEGSLASPPHEFVHNGK